MPASRGRQGGRPLVKGCLWSSCLQTVRVGTRSRKQSFPRDQVFLQLPRSSVFGRQPSQPGRELPQPPAAGKLCSPSLSLLPHKLGFLGLPARSASWR